MYYPKSQITENQYTDGSSFIDSLRQSYKGYYYFTTDGRYFTGKTYTPTSKELFKNIIRDDSKLNHESVLYSNISTKKISSKHPSFYFAAPTDKDYEIGYYKRYFSKRINGGIETILEIDKKQFDYIKDNILYNKVELVWRLTEDQLNNITVDKIRDINTKNIQDSEKELPELSSYLINPLQFLKQN